MTSDNTTGASSPITVSGLPAGNYRFQVQASSAQGPGVASAASAAVAVSAGPGGTTGGPSGVAMPTTAAAGPWAYSYGEDFARTAAIGQFGAVYGTDWNGYSGFNDTSGRGTYSPDRVLSAGSSVLDIYVHTSGGVHLVAAPMPRGYDAQLYGRFSVRFRMDTVVGYKIAWLLWPQSNNWADGEIDWPEGDFGGVMSPASERVDTGSTGTFDPPSRSYSPTDSTGWHTAVTEWTPGLVRWYWDGVLVTQTTDPAGVASRAMRWTLQTETATDGTVVSSTAAGHAVIDWVTCETYTGS